MLYAVGALGLTPSPSVTAHLLPLETPSSQAGQVPEPPDNSLAKASAGGVDFVEAKKRVSDYKIRRP